MPPTKWETTKRYSKTGFDKAYKTIDKLQKPVNRLSNKLGAEAFWPTTLDIESDKAARILRSFCKDGFYADITNEEVEEQLERGVRREDLHIPRGTQRVIKKIPASVIREAKGLAIFTTMRTGLWMSGSGGSGVLLAKNEETGQWSPPSGIMTQTMGVGFLVGVDIYDCVVVINTYEALEGFKSLRCTLGGEATATAGPIGMGGLLESEIHKRRAPVWTYIKGRGFYAGVEIAGTVVIERTDENERFYGHRIPVADILAGKVRRPPSSISTLMQTIKAAQGDNDVDENMLPSAGETPGDMEVEKPFGVPDTEDPDPYGVKALEREGVMIRESGSRRIPSIEAFEFRPNPTSPIYSNRSRWSIDSGSKPPSWRQSVQSAISVDRGTQTSDGELGRAGSGSSRSRMSDPSSEHNTSSFRDSSLGDEHWSDRESTTRPLEDEPHVESQTTFTVCDQTVPASQTPVTATSPTFSRARLVTIPKRNPPALPPRNPGRVTSPVTPGSPLSETGKTGLLSPNSGYDEDVKIVELSESLPGEDSQRSREPLSRRTSNEKNEDKEDDFYSPTEGSSPKKQSVENVWHEELNGL